MSTNNRLCPYGAWASRSFASLRDKSHLNRLSDRNLEGRKIVTIEYRKTWRHTLCNFVKYDFCELNFGILVSSQWGGVITMYVNALEKQLLFKVSVFIFKNTLDITFRLELLMWYFFLITKAFGCWLLNFFCYELWAVSFGIFQTTFNGFYVCGAWISQFLNSQFPKRICVVWYVSLHWNMLPNAPKKV